MVSCAHNEEHIKLIDEKFWDSKVRCDNCGEVFDVPGWGRRGVGGAFLDGLTAGLRGLVGSVIRGKND